MMNTISMAEKPTPHISEPDWKGRVWNMRSIAETKTSNSYELRNDDRQTRNEAAISRKWANYHNNLRISDRLTEVRRWLNILGGAMQNLKNQSDLLMAEKFETEKSIETFCYCLNVLSECRLLRDSKNKINLVYDGVTDEIKLEIGALENTKRFLTDKCFAAWDQNNRLQELIFKLENDIADKREAVEIDVGALKLDNTSVSATYKPDVLRLPASIVPYETWLEQAELTHLAADNEATTAQRLREALVLAREKSKMDYQSQYEATNFQLRKRIYETLRLKTELEWQRKNVLSEMEKLNKEIDRLVKCKEESIQYLKCAESRLETRNQRPALEQTRDEPQQGLYEEITTLRQSIEDLTKKISDSKCTYNQMESYLLELETEIKYKEQSIKLDNDALEIHKALIVNIPISQVDRNIELLNMSKDLPAERPVIQ